MALTGHLSDLSLSELIEFFCNQRKTGQLTVLYPQGHGVFYIHSGSVVDARIGVLRGIEAVYFALTLPNAQFEFGASSESTERTINQPWTQVVLEGLRRLDEGLEPAPAFPPGFEEDNALPETTQPETAFTELEALRVPTFLSFNKESMGKRRFLVTAAVAVVVLGSVAAIGVPAGWYRSTPPATAASQSSVQPATPSGSELMSATESAGIWKDEAPASTEATVQSNGSAASAKSSREPQKAKAREERTAAAATAPTPPKTLATATAEKPGAKKITVSVTYDESGRVTQASGGDASAVRIARQKRFPAGKAGSATITIPIN